jgi:hypothetical protein
MKNCQPVRVEVGSGHLPDRVTGRRWCVSPASVSCALVKNGMRALKQVLGKAAASWQLIEAPGITSDGRTVIGNGVNPDGKPEGFVVRLL